MRSSPPELLALEPTVKSTRITLTRARMEACPVFAARVPVATVVAMIADGTSEVLSDVGWAKARSFAPCPRGDFGGGQRAADRSRVK